MFKLFKGMFNIHIPRGIEEVRRKQVQLNEQIIHLEKIVKVNFDGEDLWWKDEFGGTVKGKNTEVEMECTCTPKSQDLVERNNHG